MSRDMRRQAAAGQAFLASSPISFDLPRDSVYKEINLSLEYAASTGVGGALAAPIFDRTPWTAIKRIDLIADGKDVIKSYDGGTLLDINQWDYAEYPHSQVAALGASATNGTAAAPLWHNLTISLACVGMQEEMDPRSGAKSGGPQMSFLDARKLSSLELKITFGAGLSDLFTTVTAPATLDRYFLTPWTHEILDISPSSTFAVNQEIMTSTAFPTAAAVGRQFKHNVGNAYRRVMISTVDTNARAAVDRITKIQLQENGTFFRRSFDAGQLKQMMSTKEGMALGLGVGPAPVASPAIQTFGRNGGNRFGLYVVDIAEDGRVGSLLDTRGYSDLSTLLDWDDRAGGSLTDLIRFTPQIILPNVR